MGILPRVGHIARGKILFADPETGVQRQSGQGDGYRRPRPQGEPMRAIRGGRISIIFQEPMTSLSPLHTIGDQIGEALHLHRDVDTKEGEDIVADMLNRVGFKDPRRAPLDLSIRVVGRIAATGHDSDGSGLPTPHCSSPTSRRPALDVTIQAQILKLLQDLQAELGMAILMITHDLGVVANLAEEVVVMYRGQVMESGTRDDIFRESEASYLRALLHAVPRFNMAPGERLVPLREIKYEPEALAHTRTPWPKEADCRRAAPVGAPHHQAVLDPQVGLVRQLGRHQRPRRRRHQLRHQTRRMPGLGRRIRLRQDHAVEDFSSARSARTRARCCSTTAARSRTSSISRRTN